MTWTDFVSNFWILIPLGLIVFIIAVLVTANDPKDGME